MRHSVSGNHGNAVRLETSRSGEYGGFSERGIMGGASTVTYEIVRCDLIICDYPVTLLKLRHGSRLRAMRSAAVQKAIALICLGL